MAMEIMLIMMTKVFAWLLLVDRLNTRDVEENALERH
jgi:hypothetical protein